MKYTFSRVDGLILLFLIWHFSLFSCTPPLRAAESMKSRISTKDEKSNITCEVEFLREVDGGVYGFLLALHKSTDGRDILLQVNDERSSFVMVTITDATGKSLSKTPRRLTTDIGDPKNKQSFSHFRLTKTSNCERFVPISACLENPEAIEVQNARIVINVAFGFSPVDGDKTQPDPDFKPALLTLHDFELRLTQKALRSEAQNKYENKTQKGKGSGR